MEKYMTAKDVAEMLQMSKAKVYLLAKKRQIPHIKIERNIRFKESAIVAWIEKQTEPAK